MFSTFWLSTEQYIDRYPRATTAVASITFTLYNEWQTRVAIAQITRNKRLKQKKLLEKFLVGNRPYRSSGKRGTGLNISVRDSRLDKDDPNDLIPKHELETVTISPLTIAYYSLYAGAYGTFYGTWYRGLANLTAGLPMPQMLATSTAADLALATIICRAAGSAEESSQYSFVDTGDGSELLPPAGIDMAAEAISDMIVDGTSSLLTFAIVPVQWQALWRILEVALFAIKYGQARLWIRTQVAKFMLWVMAAR
ncbi:hypothetical protein BCR44DRAFT_34278 [Catenaria anguillulae PL171]|uniref:Uncharacterized protein n=1 Tax=Catenaria anguillulae PL171 TaxID=765915 RepID=A0A1Y2HKX5_9FUNG|nr:hypothetical protein BCR44DRAFT_34278 [Catenaria anguillulae PL171]